ncbi:hypothetical protein CWE22_10035 [Pseudidiomarina aestuarii]|uniref:Uncharacterized protein n=1 Tax=Pseudidiomarina aestuarii TaxID=624146 RepID=A0A7Z6ZSK1_9GAMM|nr:hypothetical protein CWE22_10035 [Pseudidiomarina aestuarii]
MDELVSLHEQLEQKKRVIATWEFTLNRAKGEVERLNQEIDELASRLARLVVKNADKLDV